MRLFLALSSVASSVIWTSAAVAQAKPISCDALPFIISIPATECSVEHSPNKRVEVFRANFHDPNSAASIVLYRTEGTFALITPEDAIQGITHRGTARESLAQGERPWAYEKFLIKPPARSHIRPGKYYSFPAMLTKPLQGTVTTCGQFFKFGTLAKYYFSGLFCMAGESVSEPLIDLMVESLRLK